MTDIKVIVTAGGSSSRFGNSNKLLTVIKNKPVIQYSVDLYTEMGFEVVIPSNKSAVEDYRKIFKDYQNVKIIVGGATRQESVKLALRILDDCSFVLIHDAARPLITQDVVIKCIEAAKKHGGAIVGVKTTDTIKQINSDKIIQNTLKRDNLINVQTPQVFQYNKIRDFHEKYSDSSFTDDSALYEIENQEVYFVEGEYSNIKITTQTDIKLAELLLEQIV